MARNSNGEMVRYMMYDATRRVWVVCGECSGQIKQVFSRNLGRWVTIPD
jgi:hypothetical protein